MNAGRESLPDAILDGPERINLVKQELDKLPGKKRKSALFTMVACPFHNDGTPSGRIAHNPAKPRSIGWYKCYACNDPMKWNDFAARTGLQPFEVQLEKDVPQLDMSFLEDELLSEEADFEKEDLDLYPLDGKAQQFLELGKPIWRGFQFKFLRSTGAQCAYQKRKDTYSIYLPVNVFGELRGYIKARPKKVEGYTSYFNVSGPWAHKYGLYLYDEALALMKAKGLKTIVLVEGPRDALRLLRAGVPAMAILGTHSWTTFKVRLLEQTEAENVIIGTDGDSAGEAAARLLYSGKQRLKDGTIQERAIPLHSAFNTSRFDFREYLSDPSDPEAKIDPGNAPFKAIKDLRALLT